MRVGVVAVMAKVIEFYVPDRLRERRLWNPPEQRGKVIEFPSKITGVTSQFERCEAALVPWRVKKTTQSRFSLGRFPRTKSQYIRSMTRGRGFPIGSLPCSLRVCFNIARAACVRGLPKLPSNSVTRSVCGQLMHTRITPLASFVILYITPSIPAAFSARCDRNHFPVTLV
jgi:hypothetical protein